MASTISPPRPYRLLHSLRFTAIVALAFLVLNFALTAQQPVWETPAGWARIAGLCFGYSALIRFTIDALFWLGGRWIGARFEALRPWQRRLYFFGLPMLGVAIAMPLGQFIVSKVLDLDKGPRMETTGFGALAFMLLVVSLFFGFFTIRNRQLRAEREAAQTQLRLLQAQIEPHFLFNTLANVQSLMDADPPRAKAMLESFTDYLRASFGTLRRDEQTLGSELALVEAYLSIIKIRMDDRLSYRIDVPDALRERALPGLSLQPLVENAIQHGLEPSIAGGSVTVSARVEAGALVIDVVDDGLGLNPGGATRGSSTAVANIRARLSQAFGSAAGLSLAPNPPHGVRATLHVPTT